MENPKFEDVRTIFRSNKFRLLESDKKRDILKEIQTLGISYKDIMRLLDEIEKESLNIPNKVGNLIVAGYNPLFIDRNISLKDSFLGIPNIIYEKLGINLTDLFIMNIIQTQCYGLFFLPGCKLKPIVSGDCSKWFIKEDGNLILPITELYRAYFNILKLDPKVIVINLSTGSHRNLIIIDLHQKIFTYFEPNLTDFDVTTYNTYIKRSNLFFSIFESVIPRLKLGQIWKNVDLILRESMYEFDITTPIRTVYDCGLCSIISYIFLKDFICPTGNGLSPKERYFNNFISILKDLMKYKNIYKVYEDNTISETEMIALLPQLNI